MSAFKILEYRERAESLWGLENKEITELELEALLEGKRLWTNINGEYAMTIRLKDRLNELNIDREKREFIKYLEDENKKNDIKANGMGASSERDELIIKARSYREVLQKYKEIIGYDK